MATLVLSAVGGLVGGPFGAALGAIVGQQVDNRLLAPKGRKGPRLNELAVQTSAYGSTIPKLFGVNRVSPSVIWATDLRETKKKVSNGKGQPKTTVFSYSASFAVALSARPILRIERIWADANLLRGAAGDFKTQTGFRLYLGDEDQAPDPLIASIEGIGSTPAYRGMAYAVFEDFQLGEYGNRIPSLSFEVVADDEPIVLGDVVEELAGGGLMADWPYPLGGVAVTGDSLRGLIESFAPLLPIHARDGADFALIAANDPPVAIATEVLGATKGDEPHPPIERERLALGNEPTAVSVAHYEPSRDYQQGLQRVTNPGGAGGELRLDLPAVAAGSTIKGFASAAAARTFRERVTARIRLPWRALNLRAGDAVTLPGDTRVWRIESITFEEMTLIAQLRARAMETVPALAADGGTGRSPPDLIHGATLFELIDLPPLDASVATAPRLVVAAAGAWPGWRSAALLASTNGGVSWEEAGVTASSATLGTALTVLAAASPHLLDEQNAVEIELIAPDVELNDASAVLLDTGTNTAMLGNEIVQFGSAVPVGPRRYRLRHLLRGRRGSEWAIGAHAAGERFVLLEEPSLAAVSVPPGAAQLAVMASGVGDTVPPVRTIAISGEAMRPPSVCHLSATRDASGDTLLEWVRRSRNGWSWVDGADAPLVEESERYRLLFAFDNGAARTVETTAPVFAYSAAERAADITGGAAQATVSVAQLGSLAASRPATIAFTLG